MKQCMITKKSCNQKNYLITLRLQCIKVKKLVKFKTREKLHAVWLKRVVKNVPIKVKRNQQGKLLWIKM